jgi:V8-like Glu-specific endopeptidase
VLGLSRRRDAQVQGGTQRHGHENSSNDWALIVLKNPLSIRPVPVKAITREQLDSISKSGTIMQVGYGAERPYSPSIARKCRIRKSPDDRSFFFRCLANFGYSGSPILAEINGTPTVIGVASAAIREVLLGIACSANQFEKPVTELIGPASNGG